MAIDAADLVAAFYDAAFDAVRFPAALAQLAEFGRGIGAGMLVWDRRLNRPALVVPAPHMGADAADVYTRHYAAIDPFIPRFEAAPPGRWATTTDFFDDAFVATDAFFSEYWIPRGSRDIAAARVLAGAHIDAYVGVHRRPGQAPFSRHEVQRLADVGRHLARAIKVYLEVAHAGPGRQTAAAVLERSPPAVLVDAGCSVLFANPAAEAMLAADLAIGAPSGRLSVRQAADDRRLQRLVAAATGALGLDPVGGEMLVARAERAPIAMLVTPAGPTTTLSSLTPVPAALVLLHDPAHRASHPTKRLQALFGLTAAEAALALGLLDGKRLTEIAAARKVSVETVRTQLRALFKKTGVARQADLMRTLLALPERRSG